MLERPKIMRKTNLRWLTVGQSFTVCEMGTEGVLIRQNESRSLVNLNGEEQSISPGTEVFPGEIQTIEKTKKTLTIKEPLPPANPLGKCLCGCGDATSGSRFKPGHDARFHGRIRRITKGTLTMAELQKEIGKKNYALPAYEAALTNHDR